MMKYKIKAPDAAYDRKIAGLQFVNGQAVTENNWLASWFSGRDGFMVTPQENGDKGEHEDEGKSSKKSGKPSAGNTPGNP